MNMSQFIILLILIILIVFYSCKTQRQNSLSITFETNFMDSLKNIDITFYKSKLKDPAKENVWRKNCEKAYYHDLKKDSNNILNLEKAPKGTYTLLICTTIGPSRWCFGFDTIEIKRGKNYRVLKMKIPQYITTDSL
jgi:hypothetical protein